MIDMACISVFFLPEYVTEMNGGAVLTDMEMLCSELGMTLIGEVYFEDGERKVNRLRHNFESLPSSFGSLAYKVVNGTDKRQHPYVRISGNPAKLLQGHNVYGSDDLSLTIFSVVEAFTLAFPELSQRLDWFHAVVDHLDVTYTARVENTVKAQQLIDVLRNLDYGQTKVSDSKYKTTVYWNKGSEHRELKAYLKEPELERQIIELTRKLAKSERDDRAFANLDGAALALAEHNRAQNSYQTNYIAFQLSQLSDPKIKEAAQGAIRFEARLKHRWLTANGINCTLAYLSNPDNTAMLPKRLPALWRKAFQNVFQTFEGATMSANSEEQVLDALLANYSKISRTGKLSHAKALRLHKVYRLIIKDGFEATKRATDRATFMRQMRDFTAIGLSRAQLMQYTGQASNVVPLIRFINVDFAQQLPADWVEPLPLSQQIKKEGLRLVS